MRLLAFLLALAGGVLALLTVAAVFFVVAEDRVRPQLGLAALFAVVVIALAGVEVSSRQTRNAGIALILLSSVALVLGRFSEVFALRPLLFGYALSLVGGLLALFVPKRGAGSRRQ